MTDVRDRLIQGSIGLAAFAGLVAAGVLLTRPQPPKPAQPVRAPKNTPLILAPPDGLIQGRDLHRVQQHLRHADGPVHIIVHVYGGVVSAVDPIVHALVSYPGKVSVYVPYMAYSGGTLVALAADRIVMGEYAVLGPVDPQIGGFAAADLRGLTQVKTADEIDDVFHLLASLAEKSDHQTQTLVRSLVKSEQAVEILTSGRLAHSTGITPGQARKIGLPVEVGVPEAYFEAIDRQVRRPLIFWGG